MSYIWQPGVECVCINDDWPPCDEHGIPGPSSKPIKGNIYTVTRVVFRRSGRCGLMFPQWSHLAWHSAKFRPVKKTSIEVFNQILLTAPIKVREDA